MRCPFLPARTQEKVEFSRELNRKMAFFDSQALSCSSQEPSYDSQALSYDSQALSYSSQALSYSRKVPTYDGR